MEELIKNFASYPVATLLIVGILIIIASITKGGIKLGFTEIPAIESKQSKLLGGLGMLLIIAAILVALKPWERNHFPLALNDDLGSIWEGEKIIVDVLANDSDEDRDSLKVAIVTHPKNGSVRLLEGKKIEYTSDRGKAGEFSFDYEVSDGKGGKDTATVGIKVKAIIRSYKGELKDIFGNPKDGIFDIDFHDKSNLQQSITANEEGIFKVEATKKYPLCNIIIEEKKLPFYLDNENKTKTLIYNPIDSISIVFCKKYDKANHNALKVFKNRFEIPFSQLEVVPIEMQNGNILNYGRLCCGLQFYGSDNEYYRIDKSRELDFKFIQKTGDKISFEPIPINSGISPAGWDSNLNKRLLKGKYELQIISKAEQGKVLKFVEFEII